MSYFDKYMKRLAVEGATESDAFAKSTLTYLNDTFKQSPSYRQAVLNSITPIELRLVKGKKIDDSRNKSVIFRPNTKTPIGSLLTIDSQTWLLVDSDFTHELIPKGSIMLCNTTLRWIDRKGVIHSTPCVATSNVQPRMRGSIMSDRENVNAVHDGIGIFTQNNIETATIDFTTRFILDGSAYQVFSMDNLSNVSEGVEGGVIEFLTRLDTVQPTDDLVKGIASVKTSEKASSGGGNAW